MPLNRALVLFLVLQRLNKRRIDLEEVLLPKAAHSNLLQLPQIQPHGITGEPIHNPHGQLNNPTIVLVGLPHEGPGHLSLID